MKIKVRRLKEIIEEELDLFKKLHEGYNYKRDEDEYDIDTEDVEEMESSEAPGTGAGVALGDLKKVLEKWEEGEYDSDEERWQEYAKDVQGLVDQHEGEEESEEHTEEECEEVHAGQTHEEWEGGQEEEKPKKSKKAGAKNFPYESKRLEQMVYQKLITALGAEE